MKQTHRFFLGVLLAVLFSNQAFTQKNEIGFFLGGTYYNGDLNPGFHFANPKPAAGLTFRHNYSEFVSLKYNAIYAMLSGNNNTGYNEYGNLSFSSQRIEGSATLEVNFFPFFIGSKEYISTPYIFGGLAAYYLLSSDFSAENTLLPSFQPYGIEQPRALGFAMPFGIGYKTKLREKMCLSFEWGLRKTFYDQIDHIDALYILPSEVENAGSADALNVPNYQIGSDEDDDWYTFAGVHLTFRIKNKTKLCKMYDSVK